MTPEQTLALFYLFNSSIVQQMCLAENKSTEQFHLDMMKVISEKGDEDD
jgi:hypothetical protein